MSDAAAARIEPPFQPPRVPRLGIIHLMLWTLCSAVCLALIRPTLSVDEGQLAEGLLTIQRVRSAFQSVIAGAALTGTFILLQQRFVVGAPLIRHPGHWLLLVSGAATITSLPLFVLAKAWNLNTAIFQVYGTIYFVCAVAYAWAGQFERSMRWKLVFVALMGLCTLQGLSHWGIGLLHSGNRSGVLIQQLGPLANWARVFLSAIVAVATMQDLTAREQRDWLHWAGVVVFVANTVVMVGQISWMWIIWK